MLAGCDAGIRSVSDEAPPDFFRSNRPLRPPPCGSASQVLFPLIRSKRLTRQTPARPHRGDDGHRPSCRSISATTSPNGRLFASPASILLIRRSISSSHAPSTSGCPVASLRSRSVRASLNCSSCGSRNASCVISANFELTLRFFDYPKAVSRPGLLRDQHLAGLGGRPQGVFTCHTSHVTR